MRMMLSPLQYKPVTQISKARLPTPSLKFSGWMIRIAVGKLRSRYLLHFINLHRLSFSHALAATFCLILEVIYFFAVASGLVAGFAIPVTANVTGVVLGED